MIGQLRGAVIFLGNDHFIMDVGGIGYIVQSPTNLLYSLSLGQNLTVITEMIVREDSINLYGFKDYRDKILFTNLIVVQGIGAKIALSIIGEMTVLQIINAISTLEHLPFTKISGVGEKMALRIVNELRNKKFIKEFKADMMEKENNVYHQYGAVFNDVVSALVNLGFNRVKAHSVVFEIMEDKGGNIDFNDLLRISLSLINNNV